MQNTQCSKDVVNLIIIISSSSSSILDSTLQDKVDKR